MLEMKPDYNNDDDGNTKEYETRSWENGQTGSWLEDERLHLIRYYGLQYPWTPTIKDICARPKQSFLGAT